MRRRLQKVLVFLGLLVCVLAAWVAILVALAFTTKPGDALAFITWPGHEMAVIAAAGGSYEPLGGIAVLTRSDDPDFVRHLYGAGALIVLDARVIMACRSLL
jgi:hypothetical protein